MTWIKRLALNIKIVFLREWAINKLRKMTIKLEMENTKLKNTIVDQAELVVQYKRAMMQMREHMSMMMQMEVDYFQNNDDDDDEEEGFIDPYELLKKKNTLH